MQYTLHRYHVCNNAISYNVYLLFARVYIYMYILYECVAYRKKRDMEVKKSHYHIIIYHIICNVCVYTDGGRSSYEC